MNRPTTVRQTSAGGVVYKRSGDLVEIALVATKNGTVWTIPKGLIGEGESPEETAIREVKEETGLVGKIIEKLGEIKYWYFQRETNTKYNKTVHYFLMEHESGSVLEHDPEVDDAAWFPIDEALSRVKYKGDKEIIRRARDRLQEP